MFVVIIIVDIATNDAIFVDHPGIYAMCNGIYGIPSGKIATVANETLAGDKITVTAYDMPGNTDNQENEIPAR